MRYITQRLNMDISFGTFVQVAAPNASVTSGEIVFDRGLQTAHMFATVLHVLSMLLMAVHQRCRHGQVLPRPPFSLNF